MSAGKSLVVFLRGVNVGGNKTFRPAELARALDAVNVGAAGTFVLHAGGAESAVRKSILKALEFECEVIVCRGADVVALARRAEKEPRPYGKDLKTMVSVLAAKPKGATRLPVAVPDGKDWQVRVTEVDGPFVTSVWRRRAGRLIYPNEVVEKLFGVPATTRGWSTIETLRRIVEAGAGGAGAGKPSRTARR
ncbi:MAG TPA: DUF1697 domain-containing protein [Thermoanaerobaculia bacterium]|jgi:uncharacterized protein (DUF1697 family)|nr:DUF1697 domain-containing protein [Thermoanaerobaculia bacterium]